MTAGRWLFGTPFLQITFEGIRGSSYTGDIAIDQVLITEGNCPGNGVIIQVEFSSAQLFYLDVQAF